MLGLSSDHVRKFFLPEQPAAQPEPEAPLSDLGKAIKAGEDVAAERIELAAARQANFARYQLAEADYNAEAKRITDREWELVAIEAKANTALGTVRSSTQRSNEEINEDELGKASLRKVGQLSSRYQIVEAIVPPADETEEGKRLKEVVADIAATEEEIKRIDAHPSGANRLPGGSHAEHRLSRLLGERSNLEPLVDRNRVHHGHWQEIEATKAEAHRHFANRDRLRREREEKALAAVMKSK